MFLDKIKNVYILFLNIVCGSKCISKYMRKCGISVGILPCKTLCGCARKIQVCACDFKTIPSFQIYPEASGLANEFFFFTDTVKDKQQTEQILGIRLHFPRLTLVRSFAKFDRR